MVILALIIGSALGAMGGLVLGDMVKFSFEGETLNLRYIFMLLGVIIGYGVAWITVRAHDNHEHDHEHKLTS